MVSEMKQALEQTPGIASARYVSQSDARKDMVGDNADSTMSNLPPEAFPASIEVEVAGTVGETELAAIISKLQKIPSVESVETYQRYTDNLKGLLHAGVIASAILALVVFSAVVSVVASTVRLSLQRRHIEIEVLRLVGATEQYVRSPFVLEGCAQGALGAAASVAMLGILYLVVREHVHEVSTILVGVSPTFLPWYAVFGLIGLGAALGASASHVSLKRMTTV
jgi:cell division transport system permease protein